MKNKNVNTILDFIGITGIDELKVVRKDGDYCLEVTLLGETDTHFVKGIATLNLPVDVKHISLTSNCQNGLSFLQKEQPIMMMNLGFGYLKVEDGKIDFEVVGDKRKDMTLSEIEEKLGYKIKLVSEK